MGLDGCTDGEQDAEECRKDRLHSSIRGVEDSCGRERDEGEDAPNARVEPAPPESRRTGLQRVEATEERPRDDEPELALGRRVQAGQRRERERRDHTQQ